MEGIIQPSPCWGIKFFKSTRDNFAPEGNLGMPEVILVAPIGEV